MAMIFGNQIFLKKNFGGWFKWSVSASPQLTSTKDFPAKRTDKTSLIFHLEEKSGKDPENSLH